MQLACKAFGGFVSCHLTCLHRCLSLSTCTRQGLGKLFGLAATISPPPLSPLSLLLAAGIPQAYLLLVTVTDMFLLGVWRPGFGKNLINMPAACHLPLRGLWVDTGGGEAERTLFSLYRGFLPPPLYHHCWKILMQFYPHTIPFTF